MKTKYISLTLPLLILTFSLSYKHNSTSLDIKDIVILSDAEMMTLRGGCPFENCDDAENFGCSEGCHDSGWFLKEVVDVYAPWACTSMCDGDQIAICKVSVECYTCSVSSCNDKFWNMGYECQ